jgi:hypothetical protein
VTPKLPSGPATLSSPCLGHEPKARVAIILNMWNCKTLKNVSKLFQNFKASKVQVTTYKWVIMYMMY